MSPELDDRLRDLFNQRDALNRQRIDPVPIVTAIQERTTHRPGGWSRRC